MKNSVTNGQSYSSLTTAPMAPTPRNRLMNLLLATPVLLSQPTLIGATQESALRGTNTTRNLNSGLLGQNETSNINGKLDCPCIPINATNLAESNLYDPDGSCLYYKEPGQTFCYPINYGFDGCQAYDQNLPPSCNQEGFPGNPDWCTKSFCYVDPDNCKNTDHFPSTYFKEQDLHYSYKTCGSQNTFIGMINDKLDASFMELAAVIERYVVGFRFTLEKGYQSIKDFSDDPNSVAKECSYTDSCRPFLEGSYHDCWESEIDFNNANVVLHPDSALQSEQEDLNTLACLSHTIKSSFLNVADTEHDDTSRIGYLYYGDQATGGLVLYPEQPFCSETFDARFRPWYASAVSGPKDVVVVIDTSGSMKGTRIDLAKQAAQSVLNTLTWADRISLVIFNDDVVDTYSEELIASDEDNVQKMKDWIEERFVANGQTDFMIPLEKAYELLGKNKNANDQKSCSQAILFLTDGHAPFEQEKMQSLIDSNPDAVVFSYGLSSDAQQDALQQMACMTNGIYYPVRNVAELPRMMSSYYEYYAKLQDNGKLSWLKYRDAITGDEIVSGCTPIFNYGKDGMVEPDLVGVTCMDLNIIIELKSLKTCSNQAFDHFIEQIFREATQCSSTKPKIDDQCVLQNLRANINRASLCAGQVLPNRCEVGPQPNRTDFTNLNPERFEVIPLNGCTILENECGQSYQGGGNGPDGDNGYAGGGTAGGSTILGIIIGVGAAAGIVGCYAIYRCCQKNEGDNDQHPIRPFESNPQNHINNNTIPVGSVVELVAMPPPTNPEATSSNPTTASVEPAIPIATAVPSAPLKEETQRGHYW